MNHLDDQKLSYFWSLLNLVFVLLSLVPHGLTLPLPNITEKQIMVFNTLVYSDKELQSGFSKKAWPFF